MSDVLSFKVKWGRFAALEDNLFFENVDKGLTLNR